ncbi:IS66 family insertion sequence element accessory protein TnpB [Caballeronia sp. J97]|uniref:IS66 family insertion sequence element accessory protein TnpB n=1 Tax=Caballeronia sp. J97 TaxID=2805429 RepID=UPI0039EEB8C3
MRKSIDALSHLVESLLAQKPVVESFFVFVGRDCTKVNCLYRDRTGFALWYKRLEHGHSHRPRRSDNVDSRPRNSMRGSKVLRVQRGSPPRAVAVSCQALGRGTHPLQVCNEEGWRVDDCHGERSVLATWKARIFGEDTSRRFNQNIGSSLWEFPHRAFFMGNGSGAGRSCRSVEVQLECANWVELSDERFFRRKVCSS